MLRLSQQKVKINSIPSIKGTTIKRMKKVPHSTRTSVPSIKLNNQPFQKNNNIDLTMKTAKITNTSVVNDGKYFTKKRVTGEIKLLPFNAPVATADKTNPVSPKDDSMPTSSSKMAVTVDKIRDSSVIIVGDKAHSTVMKQTKRITPHKISSAVSMRANSLEKSSDSDGMSRDSSMANDEKNSNRLENGENNNDVANNENEDDTYQVSEKRRKIEEEPPKTPLNDEYKSLIEACKAAEQTNEMQQTIECKLIKYYQGVHPKFVNSKSFRRTVADAVKSIEAKPNLVYVTINNLLQELKTRRKMSKIVVVDDPDPNPNETITGDQKKDNKVRLLSKALHKLKRKIARLEESEVDFNDEDNSKYMIGERCKKRAWSIYQKICDLTGESKDAQRSVKKPIRFKDSPFREFNHTLEKFVNKTQSFPDMFDVLRCLEHCNKTYDYRLTKEECTRYGSLNRHLFL